MKNIGYADFLRVFRIDPTEEGWEPGLEVRGAGVYVKDPQEYGGNLAGWAEIAALTRHPTGNLQEPALDFPCSIKELAKFIVFYGLKGYCTREELIGLKPPGQKLQKSSLMQEPQEETEPQKSKASIPKKPQSRQDILQKIITEIVDTFRQSNNEKYPKVGDVFNLLKHLSKNSPDSHPVIQEVTSPRSGKGEIHWKRASGKEEKTSFTALQKRLSHLKKVQKKASL